jgi:hypothetical protein
MQNLTKLPGGSFDLNIKTGHITGTGKVAKILSLGTIGTGLLYLGHKTDNRLMTFLGVVATVVTIVEAVK